MAFIPSEASSQQLEPSINVTPLVDVMLVLLIIFMVITPTLAEGANIDLPSIFSIDKTPKDLDPIDVALLRDGSTMLNKEPIANSALLGSLKAQYAKDPKRHVMLKADGAVPYQRVRETFGALQEIGFHGVALRVTKRDEAGAQ